MTKENAEITIAQKIGEVRQLILYNLLSINNSLSYDRAREIAEEQVGILFNSLEEAYKSYFNQNIEN